MREPLSDIAQTLQSLSSEFESSAEPLRLGTALQANLGAIARESFNAGEQAKPTQAQAHRSPEVSKERPPQHSADRAFVRSPEAHARPAPSVPTPRDPRVLRDATLRDQLLIEELRRLQLERQRSGRGLRSSSLIRPLSDDDRDALS